MSDERILIFVCRGQARRDIDALSSSGEGEMARAALRCKHFELTAENCDILTSPTPEEKNSAKYFAQNLNLGEPMVIPWLNDENIQTYIVAEGFLGKTVKPKILIVIEKPVLVKLVAFFNLPSHDLHSGDIFVLRYPQGRLEHIR